MKKYGILFLLVFSTLTSYAAVPKKTKVAPMRILQKEGAISGGVAGGGFTMMDVRRTADTKKKIERIVVDVGDMNGAKIRGQPGYFFAEMKKNRLVIDFSQMPKTSIDEKRLKSVMKKSMAVRNVDMSLDPVDSSLNLSFMLKPNTKAKVYPIVGKKATSKVVIDLISE